MRSCLLFIRDAQEFLVRLAVTNHDVGLAPRPRRGRHQRLELGSRIMLERMTELGHIEVIGEPLRRLGEPLEHVQQHEAAARLLRERQGVLERMR